MYTLYMYKTLEDYDREDPNVTITINSVDIKEDILQFEDTNGIRHIINLKALFSVTYERSYK